MSLGGNAFLPRADQLVRDNQLVQEHIRKKLQKQDFEQSVKAQLQTKHSHRRQKILVVANRLPTKPKRDSEGNWTFERCSGGLVSCLAGIQAKFDMVWLGWPGADFSENEKEVIANEAMKQGCYPVFLKQNLIDELLDCSRMLNRADAFFCGCLLMAEVLQRFCKQRSVASIPLHHAPF